jgi:hypothetical protein
MSIGSQHLLVLIIVLASGALVGWQIVQTFMGRKTKLGSCCAKGCDTAPAKPQAAIKPAQFFPLESLTRRR